MGFEKKNYIIGLMTLIVAITSITITLLVQHWDQKQNTVKSIKVVLCQLQGVVNQKSTSNDSIKLRTQFQNALDGINNIEVKDVDEETLDLLIRFKSFYNDLMLLINNDRITPNDKEKLLHNEMEKYIQLLDQLNSIKTKKSIEYKISLNC